MYAAGQEEMRRMDQYTMEKLGLPGAVLMENAGARVAEAVLKKAPRRVVVLSGGGNNGGDGFVIARRLIDAGVETLLCLLAEPVRIRGDAKVHLDVYLNRALPVCHVWEEDVDRLRDELAHADVIVDAMLGTGTRGGLREPYAEAIRLVNACRGSAVIIAVDIPSGLGSDDGRVETVAVKADETVTFVCPKKGFFLGRGPDHVGGWTAVDISVPPAIADELGLQLPQVITKPLAAAALPKRPAHGHKGTFGHAVVIGGSRPYVGAPIFTAKAALHSGAGLVTLAVPEGIYPAAAAQAPEALLLPLAEEDGHMAGPAIEQLLPALEKASAVAIGPGIGRFEGGKAWLASLIASLQGQPVVIDADALVLLRNQRELLRRYTGPLILTPHPGEMAAMTNRTVPQVEADRLGAARAFAQDHQVFLLLKGHRAIAAAPGGELYINPYGHDALGKGGSGDVLTGLIASFLAQGAEPMRALIAASFVACTGGRGRGAYAVPVRRDAAGSHSGSQEAAAEPWEYVEEQGAFHRPRKAPCRVLIDSLHKAVNLRGHYHKQNTQHDGGSAEHAEI